jgi:hypothetical protein
MLSVSIFLSSIDSHSASQLFSMHFRLVDRQKIDRFGRLEKIPFFHNMRLAIMTGRRGDDMAFTVVGPVQRRGIRRPSQGVISVIGSSDFLTSLSAANTLNGLKKARPGEVSCGDHSYA